MLIRKTWDLLLRPFARAIWLYAGLVALRELIHLGGNYSASATFRFLDFTKTHESPWYWVAFLGGLALYFEVAVRINGSTLWYTTRCISAPLYRHMRTGAFHKFLTLPVSWHQRHNSAVLVGEVNSGIERVHEMVDATGWELLPLLAGTLLSLAPLIWFSPLSTVVLLASGAVFILINWKIYVITEPYRVARCDAQREDWKLSSEYVRGLPAVLMANRTPEAHREYDRIQSDIARNTIQEYRCEVLGYGRWRDRSIAWTRVVLIGIWLHQLRNQSLSMVDCVYLWRICEDMLVYMEGYSVFFEQVVANTEYVKRYLAFLGEPVPLKSASPEAGAWPVPERVRIEMRNVSFRYYGQSTCLEDVNLELPPGEVIGIVGTTGSGKSTLAKLICGLLEPESGDILVNGRSTRNEWPAEQVRAMVSYVSQLNEADVFARSIADNIRFADPHAPMEDVIDAAKAAGLHEDILKLADGYDSVVGESGCTLSGGQLQRLLMARELLKDAPVFILDEATSSLDVLTESRVLGCLLRRLRGKTVILISHRVAAVSRLADRILVIEDGRIVESGSPGELRRARGAFIRMLAAGRRERRNAASWRVYGRRRSLPPLHGHRRTRQKSSGD